MKNYIKTILLALPFLFASCQRVATVPVPNVETKLVLFSFLSPEDNGVEATLTYSVPIYNNNGGASFSPIPDANLVISDNNGNSKVMPFNSQKMTYYLPQSEFPIVPGLSYTITATYAGKTVKGTSIIPLQIMEIDEAKYSVVTSSNASQYEKQYLFSVKWKDDLQQHNYFRVNMQECNIYQWDTSYYSIRDEFVTDQNSTGDQMAVSHKYYAYNDSKDTPNFVAYLLNTDVHYYEYHRRRVNFQGDDPFSEPAPQYANVEGGLGVVCSYRKSKKMPFQLK